MKSFAAACLAVSAQALFTSSKSTITTGGSAPYNGAGGVKPTTIEWGYDADELFITVTTGTESVTAVDTDANTISGHVWFTYDPDTAAKELALGCNGVYTHTGTKYTPTWFVYMTDGTNAFGSADKLYDHATVLGVTGHAKVTGTHAATVIGTATTLAATPSAVSNLSVLKGSTANMETSKKMACMTKGKLGGIANLAAAKKLGEKPDTALVGTEKGLKTDLTLVVPAITAGAATASSGVTTYSGAGSVVAGVASTKHSVSTWVASTTNVYINFDFEMKLDAAVADTKKFQMGTCAKILASTNYMCVAMMVTGTSTAQSGKWEFKAYSTTTKPASFTADVVADNAGAFGAAAYIKEFYAKSDDNKTTAAPVSSTTTNFLNNTKFAWATSSGAANKIADSGKTVAGSLQYKSVEADAAAATAVGTAIKDYAATSWTGVYSDASSAKGLWAEKALAASSSGSLALTAAAGAIALAMAF